MNTSNGTIRDAINGSANTSRVQPGDRQLIENLTDYRPNEPPQAESMDGKMIRNWWKRFVIPVAVTAVVMGVLVLGGLFSSPQKAALPVARALDVVVVTAAAESSYDVHRSYLGIIESRRESRLSFEFGGKLNSVFTDEGQSVLKGVLLAELDTKLLQSDRDVIRSRIESAQARLDELIAGPRLEDIQSAKAQVRLWRSQLKLAQITAKRLVGLRQSNAVSQQESDDAVYNEQVVQAQLDLALSELAELENGTRKEQIAAQAAAVNQLKAELRTVEINIEKSRLLAPYDGIISSRLLDEGEVISSGQPVFVLLDNRQLEARVGLPVDSIDSVTRIEKHQLVYREQKIIATLKSVRPEKSIDTRTVDVVFELDSSGTPAAIGDIILLELPETVSVTGFWIPATAMVESWRGMWGCYVVEQDETDSSKAISRLRELELLHQEGDMAYVRGGLKQGEQVIVSGVHRLVPDQNIRIASRQTEVASHQITERNQISKNSDSLNSP